MNMKQSPNPPCLGSHLLGQGGFTRLRLAATGSLLLFAAGPVLADEYIPPVAHEATLAECSTCHMAFPPSLLPARSWVSLMASLDDHFGENAELDETLRTEIENYLVDHAADAGGRSFRGAPADETPLRITELRWFEREHARKVSSSMRERAGSMSNCTACHRGAERGSFEDD